MHTYIHTLMGGCWRKLFRFPGVRERTSSKRRYSAKIRAKWVTMTTDPTIINSASKCGLQLFSSMWPICSTLKHYWMLRWGGGGAGCNSHMAGHFILRSDPFASPLFFITHRQLKWEFNVPPNTLLYSVEPAAKPSCAMVLQCNAP